MILKLEDCLRKGVELLNGLKIGGQASEEECLNFQ